ncbi:hypothetical protein [Bradyrhizobium sp. Gha]|uniref:hypothetical protein n=1 Tax=Bradyrhizobium sp. Gha TaxID=1855318 RepID=UPI0015A5FC59|nr:hypothetical protein [Bradyrhizobium sp. Gha]
MAHFRLNSSHLNARLTTATEIRNVDGIIVRVPHKFSYEFCPSVTDGARLLRSVNMMRRRREGGWHGDHVNGLGFVVAMRANGYDPAGKRALLVGAGGAGSAIARVSVGTLAIYDNDVPWRDQQINKLKTLGKARSTGAPPISPTSISSPTRHRSA